MTRFGAATMEYAVPPLYLAVADILPHFDKMTTAQLQQMHEDEEQGKNGGKNRAELLKRLKTEIRKREREEREERERERERQKEIERQQKEIDSNASPIKRRDKKIAELTKELERKNEKIAELTKKLEGGNEHIAELTKELDYWRDIPNIQDYVLELTTDHGWAFDKDKQEWHYIGSDELGWNSDADYV